MDHIESFTPEFDRFILGNAPLKRLATGFTWVEGPVWFGDVDCLLFNDIPANTIHRWNEGAGITAFRKPSNFANGQTRDRLGRLITCEHGSRSVTRTEHDGRITTLASHHEGKRLNSPNDVVVARDGSIWFTDPHYGIVSNFEGHDAPQELPCNVYRITPDGTLNAMITDFNCPNGLAFSPDEKHLYVAETGRRFHEDPCHIRRFNVAADFALSGGEIFHEISPGKSDGFRMDTDGNLWSSALDGVHCLSPEAKLLGKILVPEKVSNICFGGRAKHILFITATTSLYSISLNRNGAQTP